MPSFDATKERRRVDALLARRRAAVEQVRGEKKALALAEVRVADATEAREHLQTLAAEVQQKAHKQIGKVVSRCLSSVFEDDYRLRIGFERKRGKTEATFAYLKDGHLLNPKVDSGGVMEVAALALRIAKLTLTQPPARKLLVLDEPFTGIASANMPRLGALLASLEGELGIQMVIATHSPLLQIGSVVQL